MQVARVAIVALAVLTAVLVTAVATATVMAGAATPESVRPAVATADAPPGWRRCTNRALRYSVGYPARWNALARCSYFDPKLTRVPRNTDFYGFALEVTVAQESGRNIVRGYVDPRFYRLVSRRSTRVAGHPATVLEVSATGAGLFDRGTHVYAYVVDVRGRPPILVQTIRKPTRGWTSRKRVVDTAASTLRVLG